MHKFQKGNKHVPYFPSFQQGVDKAITEFCFITLFQLDYPLNKNTSPAIMPQ